MLLISPGAGEYFHTEPALRLSHAFFIWFTCIDLFTFAVHMSAAFSIIHRNVAQN